MTVDERVNCAGLDMRDKKDWNGDYPYFEPTRKGFLVHVNKKSTLPGIFTDETRAQIAYRKYKGKIVEADQKKAAKE